MSNMIENQLVNKKYNIHHHDEITNTNIELTPSNINKYYKEVYVLVKQNNETIPIEFYNLYVDENIYKQVTSKLIIYKVSISIILKNIPKYFNKIMIKSNTDIQSYNIFNYTLGIKNIILPILNINYSDLLIYLNQYSIDNTIDNIYKLKLMNEYLETNTLESKSHIDSKSEYLCNMIDNMFESKYWAEQVNCSSTLNKKFNQRIIYFDTCRLNKKDVIEQINIIFKSKIKSLSEKEDYIRDIGHNKKNYIDIASLQNYTIEDKTDISYDHFNNLFDSLNVKEQFFLFTNSMVSKKYVHLVINNKYILDIMLPKMNSLGCLFKYLLSYSWIMFYYEECIKKTNIKTSDTFIFEIDTASKLPVFPFIHTKPKENPYMSVLVSDVELLNFHNIGGIPEYDTNLPYFRNHGICNLEEFIFRMNIFCTGNPNYNLFEDFDFKKHNVAISGSIMAACLQKNNPLKNTLYNNNFTEYFDEYYSEADVDVMFIAKDNITFINNVTAFYNQICINLLKISKEYNDVKLILNKVGYLFVTEKFISDHINNDKSKIKWIKNNINSDEVITLFKPFYEEMKEMKYKELINGLSETEIKDLEEKYPDIYKTFDVEFKIYINNKSSKDIDLVYTYKYKITSKYIKHPFELFSIKCDDFLSSVSQFHLPCVRAFYNGNVYLTPSCITAHLTYMNIDYKYVSGSTDILEIINKYRMRGFGTWLNRNEMDMMCKYCLNMPRMKSIFSLTNDFITGALPLDHKLYRQNILNSKYVPDLNKLKQFDDKLSYMDILKIRNKDTIVHELYLNLSMINKDGYVNPLKKWLINFTWDILQKYETI